MDDAERSCAASVTDALGELGGKRLDKPTAHSLGKLFQKRLVDRPAYIEDGHKIATLRKSTGHNENNYRVVSALRQAADLEAFKDSSGVNTGMNIPHIPTFPRAVAR